MRLISCCNSVITHKQNMLADWSSSVRYRTLIWTSEAIEEDTWCSWGLTWLDWFNDGSQIRDVLRFVCLFSALDLRCWRLKSNEGEHLRFTSFLHRPEECTDVIHGLTSSLTSKWDVNNLSNPVVIRINTLVIAAPVSVCQGREIREFCRVHSQC